MKEGGGDVSGEPLVRDELGTRVLDFVRLFLIFRGSSSASASSYSSSYSPRGRFNRFSVASARARSVARIANDVKTWALRALVRLPL